MINFFKKKIFKGVGINLRLEIIDEVIRSKPNIEYLEIIADNWLSEGPHHKKLEKLRQDYKILFHTVGMNIGGADKINESYLKSIKDLKEKYQPIHISDHLCFQAHNNFHHHDLLPIPYNEESLIKSTTRIDQIQNYLKENILIENLSYYIQFNKSEITESYYLNQLHAKTGCHFLIDLNNLWTNERNLQINCSEFLNEINKDAIKEIHIAGSTKDSNLYIDSHASNPDNEVISMAKKTRDQLKEIPIIYERDGNLTSLSDSLNIIKSLKI